jgi:hypothetical protein
MGYYCVKSGSGSALGTSWEDYSGINSRNPHARLRLVIPLDDNPATIAPELGEAVIEYLGEVEGERQVLRTAPCSYCRCSPWPYRWSPPMFPAVARRRGNQVVIGPRFWSGGRDVFSDRHLLSRHPRGANPLVGAGRGSGVRGSGVAVDGGAGSAQQVMDETRCASLQDRQPGRDGCSVLRDRDTDGAVDANARQRSAATAPRSRCRELLDP